MPNSFQGFPMPIKEGGKYKTGTAIADDAMDVITEGGVVAWKVATYAATASYNPTMAYDSVNDVVYSTILSGSTYYLYKFRGSTGTQLSQIASDTVAFLGVCCDSSGNVYLSKGSTNYPLIKYDASGAQKWSVNVNAPPDFLKTNNIALYLRVSGNIKIFDISNGSSSYTSSTGSSVVDYVFGLDGNVYAMNSSTTLYKLNSTTLATITNVSVSSLRIIANDNKGNIILCDYSSTNNFYLYKESDLSLAGSRILPVAYPLFTFNLAGNNNFYLGATVSNQFIEIYKFNKSMMQKWIFLDTYTTGNFSNITGDDVNGIFFQDYSNSYYNLYKINATSKYTLK